MPAVPSGRAAIPGDMPDQSRLAGLPEAVARGDEAAFEEFFSRTSDRLYTPILRVLQSQDLSEEIAQEVYLQVWLTADRFDPRASRELARHDHPSACNR